MAADDALREQLTKLANRLELYASRKNVVARAIRDSGMARGSESPLVVLYNDLYDVDNRRRYADVQPPLRPAAISHSEETHRVKEIIEDLGTCHRSASGKTYSERVTHDTVARLRAFVAEYTPADTGGQDGHASAGRPPSKRVADRRAKVLDGIKAGKRRREITTKLGISNSQYDDDRKALKAAGKLE